MKVTFAGHPIHPQLIGFPIALFPTSLAFDILERITKDKTYANAAYRSMVAGYVGAAAAAGTGVVDYLAIPSGTESKRIANMHLLMNVGVLSLYTANLLMRRNAKGRRAGLVPLLMSVVGNLALFVSGWLGGHLVYKHRMRVQGVDPIESATEIKLPIDDALKAFLERVGNAGPGSVEEVREIPNRVTPEQERRRAG